MILRIDCSYFPGDRPCRFHKETGIKCPECPHYEPVTSLRERISRGNHKQSSCIRSNRKRDKDILIIKTGAPGDVLRTTPLLSGLSKKYPGEKIYWLTDRESFELLNGNPLIYKVVITNGRGYKEIREKRLKLLINPENSKRSAFMAESLSADKKFGYGLKPGGYIYPYTKEAEYYLEMAGFDNLKRANRKTYQEILFEMCGMKFNRERDKIVLPNLQDKKFITSFKNKYDLKDSVISLHTGAGRRWELKKWHIDGFVELANKLISKKGLSVLLLGGKLEKRRNREIKRMVNNENVIDATVEDDFRKFVELLRLCDTIVCGDTLALHLSVGLGKKVVALIGPTSPWEIELYGQGVKIIPEMDCICCYRERCGKKPNCMDLISVDMVYNAVVDFN